MNKSRYILLFLLFIPLFNKLNAATCISLSSGNWTSGSTWSCGAPPTCGDSIVILTGHTVTITTQLDYTSCSKMRLTVYGTLKFTNGNKLRFPCDAAVYVMPGGSIVPGTGGGNSNLIEICNDVMWNAGSGPYTGPGCMPATQPGCGAILPVELSSFSGTVCNANKVCLKWETASEKNSKFFDVQRSGEVSSFVSLFNVNSKAPNGYSTSKINYEATDNDPLNGVSYYRLMQVNLDNSYSFSKIIAVDIIKEKNVKFVIYPNPNSGEFTADISGLENDHEVKIMLRDLSGTLLFESAFYTSDDKKNIQIIPQSKLKNGVYICSLYLEEIEYKVKVIVNAAG